MIERINQTAARRRLLGVLSALTIVVGFNSHAQSEMAEGEIRRLDMETGKVTIRHGEIKSLDMPPMTMVFYVKDVTMLDGFQVNQTIEFQATVDGKKYIVTALRRPNGSP